MSPLWSGLRARMEFRRTLCAPGQCRYDPKPQGALRSPSGPLPLQPPLRCGWTCFPTTSQGPRQERRPVAARQSVRAWQAPSIWPGTTALPEHSPRATSSWGEPVPCRRQSPPGWVCGFHRPVAAPPPELPLANPFLCPPGVQPRRPRKPAPPSLSWKNNLTVRGPDAHRGSLPLALCPWGPERAGGPRQAACRPADPPGAWTAPVHLHAPAQPS